MASSSNAPRWSADVFYNILLFTGVNERDMLFLWTTCREVSRDFKDAVERVFITKHLKKTFLKIDGGWDYSSKFGKLSLSTTFVFSRLDPNDRSRAVFVDEDCHEDIKPIMKKRLTSLFEYGNPVHRPKIAIQIRHSVNDTFIPDLEFNWDQLEIKLNWMGMYSEWFREEKEHTKNLEDFVENTKAQAIEMREKVNRGEMNLLQSLEWGFKLFTDNMQNSKKNLRAERIKRNVRKDDGVDNWDDPDNAGYNRLKDLAFAVGMEEFSDEEDEQQQNTDEYEDDGDGEEGEEDESEVGENEGQ
ncbi:hypothetical protein VNI00_005263 [Paramarasmius palmivorus]|uniref:Uncharacterized protein n=1 Tax=Paramarasmius palmivorus TaxID=297713 RepID=A0AAW0DB16_9AGAR